MSKSSIQGGDRSPARPAGGDVRTLGPSDRSDTGSDVQGEYDLTSPEDMDRNVFGTRQPGLESDSDSAGTGERGAARPDEEADPGHDILPDRLWRTSGVEDSKDEEQRMLDEVDQLDESGDPDPEDDTTS